MDGRLSRLSQPLSWKDGKVVRDLAYVMRV